MDALSKLMQGVRGPQGAAMSPPPGAPGGRPVGVPTGPVSPGTTTDAAGRPKSDSVRVTIPASLFLPGGIQPPPGGGAPPPPPPDPARMALMAKIAQAQQQRSPVV